MNRRPPKPSVELPFRTRLAIGSFLILVGVLIMLVAADWIVVDPTSIKSPRWVLGAVGFVLLIGGLMTIVGQHSRANDALAAILLFTFAIVGAQIALFADPESIAGGLPLISRETNSLIGRWVFGFGSLVSGALAIYALRRCFRARS